VYRTDRDKTRTPAPGTPKCLEATAGGGRAASNQGMLKPSSTPPTRAALRHRAADLNSWFDRGPARPCFDLSRIGQRPPRKELKVKLPRTDGGTPLRLAAGTLLYQFDAEAPDAVRFEGRVRPDWTWGGGGTPAPGASVDRSRH